MSAEASRSFVGQLSEAGRAQLEAIARRRHFAEGAVLFREDDDGAQVMVLTSGRAKAFVSAPSGREVILDIFDPGAILGELSAVDGGARSATVSALTAVDVIVLTQSEFVDFLRQNAEATTVLLQLVVTKLRGSVRRQLEFGTTDALGRLCRALVDFADRYGENGPDGVRFRMPMTQQELASFAGLSREAVVKGLATLRSLAWVRTSGRVIELLDEPAMAMRAAGG